MSGYNTKRVCPRETSLEHADMLTIFFQDLLEETYTTKMK